MNEAQPQENIEEEISTVFLDIPGKAGRTVKPGDILGENYRLLNLIGRGGMGFVYRCKHEIIRREYALKILHPAKVNEQTWMRFQVEGKAIAKLDHPNIVKIFNMGVDREDCPYYVMELLDGKPLESQIEEDGPLDLEDALDIFAQLATGLSYAHSKGIIHRDIKPSNIVLQRDKVGRPTIKIVDFGLAKLVDKKSRDEQGLTGVGEVFGSPFYMSPEQSSGGEIDERSDIYSFGCTIYKTLTGNPPFCGENAFQTMMMHQTKEPPTLAEVAGGKGFPAAVEALVQKMMAKKPQDRYQSLNQVSHDINRIRQGKTLAKTGIMQESFEQMEDDLSGEPQKSGRLSPALVVLLIMVVAGAGAAAYYLLKEKHPKTTNITHSAEQKPVSQQELAKLEAEKRQMEAASFVLPKETKLPDKALKHAIESFDKFQAKATKPFNKDGQEWLEMYFPSQPIGIVIPQREVSQLAAGTIEVPLKHPINLIFDRFAHRYIWKAPEILTKIDPTYIDTVSFSTPGYSSMLDDPNASKNESEAQILAMLSILSGWKNLHEIHFNEFTLTPKIFRLLDSFPNLRGLEIRNSDNNGVDLAPYGFLRRLNSLELVGMKNVDGAIDALHGSTTMELLNVSRTDISPKAILSLKNCPNLRRFALEETPVTDQQLDAIVQLPQSADLCLRETHLTPEKVLSIKRKKSLGTISVTNYGWSKEQLTAIARAFPQCEVGTPHAKVKQEQANDYDK